MDFKLSLKRTSYLLDIQTIINAIKINGSKILCGSVLISHPKGAEIKLFMNFGLEPNAKNPPINASLNILGFKTTDNKEFIFNINPFPCSDIEHNAQMLTLNTSYKNLGFATKLPAITDENIFESIVLMNKIKDTQNITEKELAAIASLIIVLSESIRFSSVSKGIFQILGTKKSFNPNLFEIIGWGGHSIAS